MSDNGLKKILIVEDNKIVLKILESELSQLDAEIVLAQTATEALALSEKIIPDVIAMEINMPNIDGIEICKRLKTSEDTGGIPVVFITQIESEEERERAYSAGGVFYCPTPFPRGQLSNRIETILEKRKQVAPQKVLVAEDSDTIRTIIANILKKQGHTVYQARDGLEAWELMQERKDLDLVISDINMPRMDGSHLVRLIRGSEEWEFVPIVIASTLAEKETITMLLNSGADDYIIKPFSTEEFIARIKAHVRVRSLYSDLRKANKKLQNFNESLEKMVAFRNLELLEANMESIMMLAVASEYRDTDTGNHVRRIGDYAKQITLAMGESETKAEEVAYSSVLHDVGKIAISDAILKKPGKLTEEEFSLMKTHTVHGESILSSNAFFKMARQVARSHHEKFDGSGYPDGLVGYEIPFAARVTSVADVFDALTTERVYKKAWSEEEAVKYVLDASGKDFDPLVVDSFKVLYDKGLVSEIRRKYK